MDQLVIGALEESGINRHHRLGAFAGHTLSLIHILRVHDHEGIVWDEMVGMWITLWLVPEGWVWLLLGFLMFRLFDIVKP